jgi:hypothetical protein
MGDKLCLWNVHETAENVLRSRAYTDFCEEYRIKHEQLQNKITANKEEIEGKLEKVRITADKAAVKEEVDKRIKTMTTDVQGVATIASKRIKRHRRQ